MKYEKHICGDELIYIPKPESYKDCIILVQSDIYRHTGRIISPIRIMFSRNFIFRFSFWLRMSSYKGWAQYICKYFYSRLRNKTGLQIPPSTSIGYGFYISHGFGTIINPTAVIGNNCNISQFTTIGSNKNMAAVIGNNVYIGPSVCIVENVNIGSDSTIGAGAVVTKDIPVNTTVAGVPARVINNKGHYEYIKNRWNNF